MKFTDKPADPKDYLPPVSSGPEFIFTGRLGGDQGLMLIQVFEDVVEIASRDDEHDRWSIPMVFTRDKSREIHEEE